MVFLSDEVVVDYALRMKREMDGSRLWINAYTNDVSSYIASKRVLKEGGYEQLKKALAMEPAKRRLSDTATPAISWARPFLKTSRRLTPGEPVILRAKVPEGIEFRSVSSRSVAAQTRALTTPERTRATV